MAIEMILTCGPVKKHALKEGVSLRPCINEEGCGAAYCFQDGGAGPFRHHGDVQQHDVTLEASDDHPGGPTAELVALVMDPESGRYFEPGAEYRVIIRRHNPAMARPRYEDAPDSFLGIKPVRED